MAFSHRLGEMNQTASADLSDNTIPLAAIAIEAEGFQI